MKIKNLKKIQSESFNRSFEIVRADIDEKERTVPLAFSSEDPFRRWYGIEILDHDESSVDLARLNNSAPILSDHDHRTQIGVVVPGSAVIEKDKVGRLLARFGNSKKAKQEFQDVKDGIRTKVSVGYRVHEMVLDGKKDDIEIYRATKWEPFEASLVSIPADDTVGVGKSGDLNQNNQPTFKGNSMDPVEKARLEEKERLEAEAKEKKAAEQKEFNMKKAIEDARKSENERVRAINGAAAAFKAKGFDLEEIAVRHINEGSTCESFLSEMTKEVRKKQAALRPDLSLDLNPKEVKSFNLYAALQACVSGNWEKAGFERECSIAIEEKVGKAARGIYIPPEAQVLARAQNTGTAAAGGNLVATDHNAQSFIEILRDKSVLNALGATHLYGLVGNQEIPKQDSTATAYWLAEGADGTDSESTFGLLTMSPKTISAAVPITRRMQLQSTPDIQALTWFDMAKVIANEIDIKGFEGDGTGNTPLGITNTVGINTQLIATPGTPTWAEMVGFETALATDNNLEDALNYVTTAAVRGALKTTKKDAGSGIFLMENKRCNDYPVILKNSLTLHSIIFGYFADLLIGHWGLLDAVADSSTLAKSGGLVARFFQDLDILVRQPESFCKNTAV